MNPLVGGLAFLLVMLAAIGIPLLITVVGYRLITGRRTAEYSKWAVDAPPVSEAEEGKQDVWSLDSPTPGSQLPNE